MNDMLIFPDNLLQQIFQECERAYPEEACGFVSGEESPASIIVCKNIQNELHVADPVRYPRNATTAYTIDPKEMERIQKEVQTSGKKLLAIFHSHPEHGVYFSEEDRAMAAPWGEPLFPMSYLVISVYKGKVALASEFYWDLGKKDFLENRIK